MTRALYDYTIEGWDSTPIDGLLSLTICMLLLCLMAHSTQDFCQGPEGSSMGGSCAFMRDEYQALIDNHTWDHVSPSFDRHHIGCKWVYRVKYKLDPSVDHYKARLVA